MGMNKQKQTVKEDRKLSNQAGNMHLMIIVAVVVAAIVGVGIYVWQSQRSKDSDTASTAQEQATATPTPQPTTSGVSVTLLGGDLTMLAVDGWTKGTETNLIKDIDGTSFRIAIQAQGVDYLALDTVGGYATEVSQVETTQGTTLYILKMGTTADATNYVVSTCAPASGFGCAPDFDGRKLYVTLAPLGDGSSTIAPLDYSLPATATALTDFEAIARALPL
jgi:hypothetical protein